MIVSSDASTSRRTAPAKVLRVQGAYVEQGVDTADVVEPFVEELGAMASWLGLDTVATTGRGPLGEALRGAGIATLA